MGPAALTPQRRDALVVSLSALATRLAVVAWAAPRFPAAEDGHYYDVLARRLAQGQGYTWLWPDGAVTYAAHYPVGLPALLALAYRVGGGLAGASAVVPMLVASVVGAAGAWAAQRVVLAEGVGRGRALAAGLLVAFHPCLVPYTAAVMTEGVTASLLVVALAVALPARRKARPWPWLAGAAMLVGLATLVRPPSLLLAPVLGALAAPPASRLRPRLVRALALGALALACVLPWTARNCVRMHRCAVVSVNGGWNLLIGAQTRTGGWTALDVPAECREVWDEAGKDACFERAARARILDAPLAWLAQAPAKLAVTFDYFGAGPWYLRSSNEAAFDDGDKTALGAVDLVASRLLLVVALVAVASSSGPRGRGRALVALVGVVAALTRHAWPGYLALAAIVALQGPRRWGRGGALAPWTAAVVLATAVVHAVFFGAGRYGLVVAPLVAMLAATARPWHAPPRRRRSGDRRSVASGAGREESPSSTEHDAG